VPASLRCAWHLWLSARRPLPMYYIESGAGARFSTCVNRICVLPKLGLRIHTCHWALNRAKQAMISIEQGAQVRKKADGAKDPVRQFMSKWKGKASVESAPAYAETAQALEELGQYYMKRGQRSALDRTTANSVLAHLERAEASLPAEEAKKGLLGGLFGG
jgi:Photosystem II Pbs27